MLQQKLLNYISRFSEGPIQNSQEWQVERRKYIGGSEMGTVLGKETHNNVMNLITKKLPYEITNFCDNFPKFACKWGHLFEPVIKQITNNKLKTNIVGDNIWIRDPSVHPHITNSPDGFGIVKFKRAASGKKKSMLQPSPTAGTEERITLFEFKCPISRTPKEDSIPNWYLPQIQNGLNISSEIVDISLFVDAKFVKCSIEDFKLDAFHFDQNFHNYSATKKTVDAKGYFIITGLSKKLIDYITNEHPEVLYENPITKKKIIDFGKCNYFCFVETLIDDEFNSTCTITSSTTTKINFKTTDNQEIIGILPWKLVKLVMVTVESDNNKYKSSMYPKIDDIFHDIELIKENHELYNIYISEVSSYLDRYNSSENENSQFKTIKMNKRVFNDVSDEIIRDFLHKRIFGE